MRRSRPLIVVFMLVLVAAARAVGAAEIEPVPVDIALDKGVLKSVLYRPAGTGPFHAVVALHGCAGLRTRGGAISIRYRDWAERLVAAGFVVLLPDSFGSRGLGPQCAVRRRTVRSDREWVADANAARRWLQAQPYVDKNHVTLLGWSSGATAALWTVRRRTVLAATHEVDFRSAVAFYPGCRRLDNAAWSARIPTLILIGGADDWTSAQACRRMIDGARGRSAEALIIVYPGAYHDFDYPDRPLRARSGVAFAANGIVHSGTNPTARADALKRVPEWLAR